MAVTLLGFFAGASYQQVATRLGQTGAVIGVVLAVAVVVAWVRHRRRTRPAGAGAGEE
ncbi:MAG: hypothetical protein R2731_00965 [Nocardioides sp.]